MNTLQLPAASSLSPGLLSGGAGANVSTQEAEEEIAPSRAMEYWLFGIMIASLTVSISGLAFVYGFNLANPFSPANISPAVRGIIVDSIMFLGVYFTRRFFMQRGRLGWRRLWGVAWLVVALAATSFSWFSNDLAVNATGTIVTPDLLAKAGFGGLNAADVDKVIAALPIVAVLLYGIVPRRTKAAPRVIDTRTPEEILREAEQEAARIQAARLLRQARTEEVGEGLGDGINALTRGVNLALGRDPAARQSARKAEDNALHQMRVLLLRHGWVESLEKALHMRPEQVRLLAESKQLWNPAKNEPMPWALLPTEGEKRVDLRKLALAQHWLTPQEVEEEDEMRYSALEARYAELALRAEELRRQEEEPPPTKPSADAVIVPGAAGRAQAAPLDASLSDLAAPTTGEAELDGFTPKELAERLGKSRSTILNYMKPSATEPYKIYGSEVFKDTRGTQRILPSAYLRLSRALAAENGPLSRDSSPRLAAMTKATQNGGSHANEAAVGADEESQ